MNKQYYTEAGEPIRYPKAYAKTGAPMFETQNNRVKDINAPTTIYKLNLENGKKYVGKTTDVDRRMKQHFSGGGAKVTQKFKPKSGEIIDEVPGFFSDDTEQYHTEQCIKKHGYSNVRGGRYTNSKTLHKTNNSGINELAFSSSEEYSSEGETSGEEETSEEDEFEYVCYRCGRSGHTKPNCYASTHVRGYQLYY